MSNFLIFKAAFNNSATPAIGTYTAEGATAQFNINTSLSPDYYLYNTALYSAVQWFVPTAETTDFEFVADILTRYWDNRVTYFIIADSTGTTRLRMWSVNDNWYFENSDSTATTGSPEFIGNISPTTSGGFGVFHQFRVRVRKLTESSSSVEVYVDGTLKLTATAGAALITCAKIGFVGGVNSFGPGTGAGIKNAYVYDLSGGDVIDRGVLSGAFNRFISWMKSKFALKSDIPTVNNATLTIQRNGTNVQTFTANASTNATANITVPTAVSELTNDSGYLTSSSNLDASKLTSGTVDIARLPQGALERLVKVANETARYALTTADVQLGDTVQQLDTGIMYVVTDTDHLDSAAGYTEYTAGTAASVPWSGVTGKPTFAAVATSGAYSDLTGTPTIPTVNDATLTIQQNGTTVDTFTANSSSDKTVNISVPTKTSDLTNDSGFLTLESLGANSIPFHNSYPRCKYLGTSITDAQNTAIKNRTYDELFIGDYWTINGVNWRIVAIDYYYNVGDTNFNKGNIIVMPDTVLYNAQMNDTNTTAGAYYGSLMRTQNLNSARTVAQNAFGSHLANHRIFLANSVDASGASGWAWYDSDGVELPNEVQIYGTRIWGSALKGYDVATQKQQFPLLALAPQFVNTKQIYWLQDVSSSSVSSDFARVSDGNAGRYVASYSYGVRPSVTLSYI